MAITKGRPRKYHPGATHRVCLICGEEKPVGEFSPDYWRESTQYMQVEGRCLVCKRAAKYGMTNTEWEEMLIAQSGRCAICNEPMKVLHTDHCHDSGKVRGMLCSGCNLGVGHFKNNPEVLRSAVEYLS